MKTPLILLIMLVTLNCQARPIHMWQYQELADKSDVVAVCELASLEASTNTAPFQISTNFQCFAATLTVLWTIKGDAATNMITILTYRYVPNTPVVNGAHFANFSDTNGAFLVFLKQTEDGRFTPTSGDYDSGFSLKHIDDNVIRIRPK